MSDFIMNTYGRFPITLEKGEGCYVWDTDGKKYLDFVAGIAVNSLGHADKELCETIAEQVKKIIHVSNLYWTEPQINLGEKLIKNSCFDKAFFCNSGAEAIEGLLKLSRKYATMKENGRYEIITMKNSFHGRTYGAITATGQEKYQKGLNPLLPGIIHTEYNNSQELINAVNEKTCAILIEPLQGEGGIRLADKEFLQTARELCDKHDIMLIYDEIQCGVGRMGSLFAYEHSGVEPDCVALAKGLAGGVPIGAILAKDNFASAFKPGDHASTFGGNPLATAAGCVIIDRLVNKGLIENVKNSGQILKNALEGLAKKHSCIKEVRGTGLIQGIELDCEAAPVINKCVENGMLLVNAGTNVIRFVPPLTVTEAEIGQAMLILEKAL